METNPLNNVSLFNGLKIRIASALSQALGKTVSMFLIIGVLTIVLGLLAFALLQFLNGLLGAPWGTLCVAGAFLILLVVLYIFRNRMFRDGFVRIFSAAILQEDIQNAAQLEEVLKKEEQKKEELYASAITAVKAVTVVRKLFRKITR